MRETLDSIGRLNAPKDDAMQFQRGEIEESQVEVQVGSGSVIVEQTELEDLIEVVSEMRYLVADGRALINIGSA